MNSQHEYVAGSVLKRAEELERLAKTWEASAERYFRLAKTMTPGSFARAKVSAHAVECQAFADQLRDTYSDLKAFYRGVAQEHLAIAQKFALTPYHALHHLGCADRALTIAESL